MHAKPKPTPVEPKKDYIITGNIEYHILNWSNKEKKLVPSEKRNKNFQFIVKGVQKSTITNAAIDIGAETSVHELEGEYEDIEKIAHNNVRITEVSKSS